MADNPNPNPAPTPTPAPDPARKMIWAVEQIFTYHPPTPEQVAKYTAIRAAAMELAQTIIDNTPPGADQTAAIRLLRETVMTANAAVALKGLNFPAGK